MINCTVKLIPTSRQQRQFSHWLWHLTGVWNWAVRKIELDARGGVYHTAFDLNTQLRGHSQKIGIQAQVIQEMATAAQRAWAECFSGLKRRPKLKGRRNRLNSLVFRRGVQVSARRIGGFDSSAAASPVSAVPPTPGQE